MRKFILAFALLASPAFAQQSPADKSYAAGMDKMHADMSAAPMTGNADQDFVAMMLRHHEGAIAMAETELQYGKDPKMRQLAKDIISAQNKEIAEMRAWQSNPSASN
jgi:uncharacterized protein (DUF305 family)